MRVALAHGFDKEGIAKQLLKGYVEPAWQAISPLSWAHNPNVVKHTYDPAKAKQVLDAAGCRGRMVSAPRAPTSSASS